MIRIALADSYAIWTLSFPIVATPHEQSNICEKRFGFRKSCRNTPGVVSLNSGLALSNERLAAARREMAHTKSVIAYAPEHQKISAS